MEQRDLHSLEQDWQRLGLNRRDFLRLLAAGVSATTIAGILAACGGSAAAPTPTTAAAPTATTAAARPTTAAGTASPGGATAASSPAATVASSPAATAGATENPYGAAQKKGGTYVVVVGATGGYPQVFRPITYYGSLTFWSCKLLFTPLILLDSNWGPEYFPGLATSWEWSADNRQLTMKLRQGVKFHDGKEFTAKDVEFTYKLMVRKEAFPSVQDVTIFEGGKEYKERTTEQFPGCQAIDDYTVKFSLVSPSSVFMLNVSNTGILPAHGFPADALTSDQDTEKLAFFTDKPFGTGPFKLKGFDLKTNITFEANKDHWKGAPNLDGIIFRLDVARPAMISGVQSGEFDGAYIGMMADAASLRDQQGLNLITNYSLANEQIFIAAHDKPYLNEKVRQALITAIDVEALSKTVGYGFPRQAPSVMMHPSLFPNPNLPKYDYNQERAKQLLREGNWDPSRKLILGASSTQGTPENLHAAIMNMWKAAGIEAEYKPFDPANNTKTWNARPHEYDVFQTSFAWLAYDPSSSYKSFACPREANYSHYCNPKYDEAMQQAIREGDPEKAKRFYQEAQVIVHNDLPYIPMWIEPEIWAINKKMHGGNLARGPLNDIQAELWWKE